VSLIAAQSAIHIASLLPSREALASSAECKEGFFPSLISACQPSSFHTLKRRRYFFLYRPAAKLPNPLLILQLTSFATCTHNRSSYIASLAKSFADTSITGQPLQMPAHASANNSMPDDGGGASASEIIDHLGYPEEDLMTRWLNEPTQSYPASRPTAQSASPANASRSSLPDIQTPPVNLDFCNMYKPEATQGLRTDGFYEPIANSNHKTIILAINVGTFHESVAGETHINQPYASQPSIPTVPTLVFTPRLLFPASQRSFHSHGWGNSAKRDKAAESVAGNLRQLEMNGFISASLASESTRHHKDLMSGDGHSLIVNASTLLRDPDFATADHEGPGPTVPSGNSRHQVSKLATIEVDGTRYTLVIRELNSEIVPSSWKETDLYLQGAKAELKTAPQGIRGNHKTHLHQRITRNLENGTRPEEIPKCVLGNVVLWPRSATSTIADSGTVAAD
jgi:hypothetical protein